MTWVAAWFWKLGPVPNAWAVTPPGMGAMGMQQQAKSALQTACNPKGILEINELVCRHFVRCIGLVM